MYKCGFSCLLEEFTETADCKGGGKTFNNLAAAGSNARSPRVLSREC